jgi:hypothetical protein
MYLSTPVNMILPSTNGMNYDGQQLTAHYPNPKPSKALSMSVRASSASSASPPAFAVASCPPVATLVVLVLEPAVPRVPPFLWY